ncbi:MAG: sulfatase [Pirellulaceae bacterium]
MLELNFRQTFGSICLVTLLAQVASGQSLTGETRQPNIVLLVADDLGYGELGCQGNPQIPTPFIDALALDGVRCTQAYVTAPNCSPSRAGLFTGRTPTRFGYEFNPIGARNEAPGVGLPTAEITIAEALQDAGYTTGLIGKWHLGGAAEFHPQRHGFDEFFGFMHEGHYFAPPPWDGLVSILRRRSLPLGAQQRFQVNASLIYTSHMGHNEPDYDANNPLIRGGQPISESEYLTDALAREACSFIERYRATPFFLCVTFNAVHSPMQAKQETLAEFSHVEDMHRRIFAAMLSDLDTAVGSITAKLDAEQLSRDTLVIFMSDNGGPTKELTSSNGPLRGGKGSMYEGGLRVPFIVRWPGQLPQDRVVHQVVSTLDVAPTVLKLAGTQLAELEGRNLLPLMQNVNAGHAARTLFWRQGSRRALRHGPWKIVSNDPSPKIVDGDTSKWELYNIDSDVGETHNLAHSQPAKVQELSQIWSEMNGEMLAPLF